MAARDRGRRVHGKRPHRSGRLGRGRKRAGGNHPVPRHRRVLPPQRRCVIEEVGDEIGSGSRARGGARHPTTPLGGTTRDRPARHYGFRRLESLHRGPFERGGRVGRRGRYPVWVARSRRNFGAARRLPARPRPDRGSQRDMGEGGTAHAGRVVARPSAPVPHRADTRPSGGIGAAGHSSRAAPRGTGGSTEWQPKPFSGARADARVAASDPRG
jgi:hypothetical protein